MTARKQHAPKSHALTTVGFKPGNTARKVRLLKTAIALQRVAAAWNAAQERLCKRIDAGYIGKDAQLYFEEKLGAHYEAAVARAVKPCAPRGRHYTFETFEEELGNTFPQLRKRIERLYVELGGGINGADPRCGRAPRFETTLRQLELQDTVDRVRAMYERAGQPVRAIVARDQERATVTLPDGRVQYVAL